MPVNISILDKVRHDRRGLLNTPRLLEGMSREGLDAVIATSTLNVTYTGGVHKAIRSPSLRGFVVTTANGAQAIVIGEADAYYFREYSWVKEIRDYRYSKSLLQANQDGIRVLGELLQHMGLGSARLGVEKTDMPAYYWEELGKVVPNAQLMDGSEVFDFARVVKTPMEIEVYRAAAWCTVKAIHGAFATAKPGDTEKQIASRMQANVLELGADDLDFLHLHTGVHSAVVHSWPMEIPTRPGDIIHVDFGAVFGGYRTDVGRTAVVVKSNPKQERIYGRLREIEQFMIDNMRPGIVAGELFASAQGAFANSGLAYPWGTMGHSIGCAVMEEGFDIAQGSKQVLEPDMIVCVEPTHIEPGEGRYRVEDTVVVTRDGVEVLTDQMPIDGLFVIH